MALYNIINIGDFGTLAIVTGVGFLLTSILGIAITFNLFGPICPEHSLPEMCGCDCDLKEEDISRENRPISWSYQYGYKSTVSKIK